MSRHKLIKPIKNRFHRTTIDPLSFESYGDYVAHYYPLKQLRLHDLPPTTLLSDIIKRLADKSQLQAPAAIIKHLTERHQAWNAIPNKTARLKAWGLSYEKAFRSLFPDVNLSQLEQTSRVGEVPGRALVGDFPEDEETEREENRNE
jgi:hypothetical protein